MNNYSGQNGYNSSMQAGVDERKKMASAYIAKTYLWLFIGLFISFGIGFFISGTSFGIAELSLHPLAVIGITVLYFIVAMVFSLAGYKMPSAVSGVMFLVYAVLQGFVVGIILLNYQLQSAIAVFAITGMVFGIMGIFGLTTKKDLTGWGPALFFCLIGLVVMGFVGIFLRFELYHYIVCAAGVVVFILYTAFDTQRIKNYFVENAVPDGNEAQMEALKRSTVMGGFRLLLNYVNIFLYLLRLMGKRN